MNTNEPKVILDTILQMEQQQPTRLALPANHYTWPSNRSINFPFANIEEQIKICQSESSQIKKS